MDSIYNLLNKPVANLNRNGFDLGEFFPWSLKLGQVKPISYFHVVPGDNVKISIDELCHTEPFITDPFVRLSKHIELVFVPYSQLWHGSSQFFGHSQDPQSSYEQGHAYAPNFSMGKMLRRIWRAVNTFDMQGLLITESALSLLDMLGYGAYPLYKMTDEERSSLFTRLDGDYRNAWALLAYYKYWNTYLRDTQHTSPLSPSIFNADKVPCTSVASSHMDSYYSDREMLELVTIKYRKTKRDLFTSSLTSRQFGAVEAVTLNLSGSVNIGGTASLNATTSNDYHRWMASTGGSVSTDSAVHTNPSGSDPTVGTLYNENQMIVHDHAVNGTAQIGGQASVSGAISGFDVYTLLTAQMMQKWREQIQRAGNQTEDRLKAVYGREPQFDAKNQPYVFGSTSYNIVASQVTSTGASEGAALGDIAAKGQGFSTRNEFNFSSSEFGVILVCTYILPENSYLAPPDKLTTLIEPFDYWVPQIENLGLEAIQSKFKNLFYYNATDGKYFLLPDNVLNSVIGYAARNWAYKQKVNKVHLGFEHGSENSKWMPSRVPAGSALTGSNPYYVDPNEYDTVFGTLTDYHLDTDQFVGCSRVSCDAVRPMSELGIPRW